ncbi:MAG: LysR substrate-binding domain-containing protein [Dokdonella sp.]
MHSSIGLPPLEALAAVLSAARVGSFSAAAVELGITHGAVSRRVHAVESWLGVAVFERHGRGVRLTPTGEHFSRHVELALSKLTEVAVDLRAARQTARVKLSVLPSFARLWLMPRLAKLQGEHSVIQVSAEHRQAKLDAREADLAIRYGRGTWAGVVARPLLGERLFAIATPKIARTLRDADPTDVLTQTLLHDTDTRQWRLWCEHAGIAYRARGGERRFEDYDLVLAAAESGVGIAIARWPLAAAALQSKRLVRIAGPEFANPKAHYIVTRNGETRSAVLQVVERLLGEAAIQNKVALRRD